MSALLQLAKMFRVRPDDVDAAIRSERGYRAAITRRNLFAAGAALAAGSVLVGGPLPVLLHVYSDGYESYIGDTLRASARRARGLEWRRTRRGQRTLAPSRLLEDQHLD